MLPSASAPKTTSMIHAPSASFRGGLPLEEAESLQPPLEEGLL